MLMARIAMRDRTYERQMDRSYIVSLRQAYDRLFSDFDATSSLIIETDDIDFVRNPEDLDDIEHRIRSALAGIRQPTLPKISFPAPDRPAWTLVPAQNSEPRSEVNWQALGDFLALAEAVGRIGGALSQQAPVGPDGAPGPVCDALRDANRALLTLAQRIDIQLESLA
jgi:hypothetical protein